MREVCFFFRGDAQREAKADWVRPGLAWFSQFLPAPSGRFGITLSNGRVQWQGSVGIGEKMAWQFELLPRCVSRRFDLPSHLSLPMGMTA